MAITKIKKDAFEAFIEYYRYFTLQKQSSVFMALSKTFHETQEEKKKIRINSLFSFCKCFFLAVTDKPKHLCINIYIYIFFFLTLSQTSPGFMCLQYKSFENTAGKGETTHHGQFLLFSQYFYLFGESSAIFIKLSSANSFNFE